MALIEGGVYEVGSVELVPEVTLTQWSIREATYEDGTKTRHFVGTDADWRDGRASGPIVSFDKDKLVGITESGRVYSFTGSIGMGSDAEYVWGRYKRINKVVSEEDVTDKLLL